MSPQQPLLQYLGPLELLLGLALHLAPGTVAVLVQGHVGVQGRAAGVRVRRALGGTGPSAGGLRGPPTPQRGAWPGEGTPLPPQPLPHQLFLAFAGPWWHQTGHTRVASPPAGVQPPRLWGAVGGDPRRGPGWGQGGTVALAMWVSHSHPPYPGVRGGCSVQAPPFPVITCLLLRPEQAQKLR